MNKSITSVSARNNQITDDAFVFRDICGAFACVLIDYYAQEIRVRGFFKRRLEVKGKGYRGELLDLLYRCGFEGLDLAPDGDVLSS